MRKGNVTILQKIVLMFLAMFVKMPEQFRQFFGNDFFNRADFPLIDEMAVITVERHGYDQ